MFYVTHQCDHVGLQLINHSYLKFPVRYVTSVLGSDDCCLGFWGFFVFVFFFPQREGKCCFFLPFLTPRDFLLRAQHECVGQERLR